MIEKLGKKILDVWKQEANIHRLVQIKQKSLMQICKTKTIKYGPGQGESIWNDN